MQGLLVVAIVCAMAASGPTAAHALTPGAPAGVVVPRNWTDPVTQRSFDLDPTGVVDVSDGLNLWLARELTAGVVPHGTQQSPTVIQFPRNAQYRLEYGLALGSSGSDIEEPGLPRFRVSHLVVDFDGGRIFQTDDTPYRAGHPAKQPRRRFGVQLLRLRLASDVRIENGTIQGHHVSASDATYTARAAWHGMQISGSSGVVVENMTIDNVWGDFVTLGSVLDLSTRPAVVHHDVDILIENVAMNVNGRQGITVNDADGLVVRGSSITNVARFVVDSEPLARAVVRHVMFEQNRWNNGDLGFLNLSAPRLTIVGDLVVADNVWMHGHLRVGIAASGVARRGLTIVGNVTSDQKPARSALVQAVGWTGVTITGNTDRVGAGVAPFRLTANWGAVTAPNHFS